MGTRSAIAEPHGESWRGKYVHWDGYPTARGPELFRLYHDVFGCDLAEMMRASRKYGIDLPDRQLCCAPLSSPEAQRYLGAMFAAANFAFANRQVMKGVAEKAIAKAMGRQPTIPMPN